MTDHDGNAKRRDDVSEQDRSASGLLRSRDITVVFTEAKAELGLLKSFLSARNVHCIEHYTAHGQNARGSLLSAVLTDMSAIWDKPFRQCIVVGDLRLSPVIVLCLRLKARGVEVFACPTSVRADDRLSLSLQRLAIAGVSAISLEHLMEEV
ncbi:hypothetical protein [Henriciella sp.]|uniref:hypothetical protein n=1 Tax=Henriciella sp. TaxID=1968823 RepID=UPI0017C7E000|nr:hypothetical protein [Henriciella sp.]HIG23802.1 hypothetical protein [Henriciella sp.]